jgi:hypothetical protein
VRVFSNATSASCDPAGVEAKSIESLIIKVAAPAAGTNVSHGPLGVVRPSMSSQNKTPGVSQSRVGASSGASEPAPESSTMHDSTALQKAK